MYIMNSSVLSFVRPKHHLWSAEFLIMRTRPQSITFNYLLISNRNEVKFRAHLLEGRLALNPGLNFNPGFFLFCSKAFSRIISSIFFRALVQPSKLKLNWLVKSSYLNSNFTLTLGYLHPVFNNPALEITDLEIQIRKIAFSTSTNKITISLQVQANLHSFFPLKSYTWSKSLVRAFSA